LSHSAAPRRKATWGARAVDAALFMACLLALGGVSFAQARRFPKLDLDLERLAIVGSTSHRSTVIVTLEDGTDLPANLQKYSRFGRLNAVGAQVLDIPDSELPNVAGLPQTVHVHPDAQVHGFDFRTGVTSGSFFVNKNLNFTGAGVTVAVLDSGVAKGHDDISGSKVRFFKDFVNNRPDRYDDYGHGTLVAGILAGSGKDSDGKEMGVAPGVQLVVLKVLDSHGNGTVANVIAALDWLAVNAQALKVRVVNLSFGGRPTELPSKDPLALATKVLVDRGIVVVAAAGNDGEVNGKKVWGGIPSPADAPWVITVGASSSMGTLSRKDDQMASFSSRGPAVGRIAKPDIVASGVGIVAPIARDSTLFSTNSSSLVKVVCAALECPASGSVNYMSMSGTSMAAPVVSGSVALMLQANPKLTPNLVKAILEYTAEVHSGYSPLEQGAGFLNTLGAVRLAKFFASGLPASQAPFSPAWSRHIYWGNYRLTGGIIQPNASAWKDGIRWGQRTQVRATAGADNIVWGTAWGEDNIIWGTSLVGDNIVWGTAFGEDNIVWGTECGGANCGDNIIWGTSDGDNIVWGTSDNSDNIIWGTDAAGDNIIWGTDDGGDNIIWGTADDSDNIIWGTSDASDNIIWGTADAGDNIIWGTSDGGDNIIWGTGDFGDDIVWGTGLAGDNIIWGTGFTFGPVSLLLPSNPTYQWFQSPLNDLHWVQVMFGDSLPNLRSTAR
jgi:serine protease AprX